MGGRNRLLDERAGQRWIFSPAQYNSHPKIEASRECTYGALHLHLALGPPPFYTLRQRIRCVSFWQLLPAPR